MNTIAAHAAMMTFSNGPNFSSSNKVLPIEDGKKMFSHVLSGLTTSSDQPYEENEESKFDWLSQALGTVMSNEISFESEIEHLPKEWQEELYSLSIHSDDVRLTRVADWSEGKQAAFLAITYTLGAESVKEGIRQNVPAPFLANIEVGLDQLNFFSKEMDLSVEQDLASVFLDVKKDQVKDATEPTNYKVTSPAHFLPRFNMMEGHLNQMTSAQERTPLLSQLEEVLAASIKLDQSNKVEIARENVESLPTSWQEDYRAIWSNLSNGTLSEVSNWSEAKQLIFLALTQEPVEQAFLATTKTSVHTELEPPNGIQSSMFFSLLDELVHEFQTKGLLNERGIQMKEDHIPKDWQQEFTAIRLETKEPLNLISNWSEEKQMKFLAFLYFEGGETVQEMVRQKFPPTMISSEGVNEIMSVALETPRETLAKSSVFSTLFAFMQEINEGTGEWKSLLFSSRNSSSSEHLKSDYQGIVEQNKEVAVRQNILNGAIEPGYNQSVEERLTRMDSLQLFIGERLPKELQQQQLVKQFQSLLKRGTFTQTPQGIQTLSIKIYPEHLGRLNIQLSQQDGILTARIVTGTQATRELVEGQLQQLRQAFVQQQLQVERVEVSHEPFERQKDKQSSKEEQRRDERSDSKSDQDEPSTFFEDILQEVTINEQI
ncbi:flagellar hook-length control protein FliK [Alkalihalobacillus sp. MEB130]|uniref:flagellar hook-length control protein FliK n=1 Tax=Alkalihalobacillus sp. MEB130 TaxID=2976704 RepID=UPI0028DF201F|nr:flagellar hook-length control protein FliK [Alkalihalobacillus sp. MEB130]MDT8859023.1 flagellar hook-length control protein FliK [Alkalihalobacillus sp. MEB130]